MIIHIKKLLDLGVSYVCLSLGKKGSIFASSETITKAYINDISELISTGAGDSMIAGFIYSFIHQFSHKETHQFMTYIAKQSITKEKIEKNHSYQKIRIKKVGE
jgi:fructose-1-phosphate kinase PfkB-like protein